MGSFGKVQIPHSLEMTWWAYLLCFITKRSENKYKYCCKLSKDTYEVGFCFLLLCNVLQRVIGSFNLNFVLVLSFRSYFTFQTAWDANIVLTGWLKAQDSRCLQVFSQHFEAICYCVEWKEYQNESSVIPNWKYRAELRKVFEKVFKPT